VPVHFCPDLDLVRQQVVEIEGVGLRLKSFKATSRSTTELELAEKTFLSAAVGNPILAVAIEQHNLKPKQSTRVFVVEQKDLPANTMAAFEFGVE
jgi:conjugal transfer pilus assembly protein TraK